ncbi:unnamed protein product [Commensalibacter papalotli (ex Botero et al. 2024)]|uniref:DUF2059 domain-containing protein n=2 Tax=Commensalibacter papalotli (ex Botero et al. 2024) TaxID=2972766 RepID=A0ABM9HQ15_9PROT|nr:unnamed protein product [Commensalibacter papalotli (ex Botero et al. 2024)]CAI3944637.1 unnamed protein product [Commensalibacter papalotli (ex Botero et al. 2024)]
MFIVKSVSQMKYYSKFSISLLVASFLMFSIKNTLADEPSSYTDMPKACQNIDLASMTFELPLLTQELTQEQRKKIREILGEAYTQACIVKMQYDGLLQQIISVLFQDNNVTSQKLKPFYDQLLSLIQNRIEINIKTVESIHKILSNKEWSILISENADYIESKNKFIRQQTGLQQSYDDLISGNYNSEFITLALMPSSFCIKNNPKIKILEQIIAKSSLTNSQEGLFRNITRLQERQSCIARQEMNQLTLQLLKLIAMKSDQAQENQYIQIFNQLSSKAYLLDYYQIELLSSLIKILMPEQKNKIRESYIIINGIL